MEHEIALQSPRVIATDKVRKELCTEFVYLNFIQFIKDFKTGGHFYQTSPVLSDISHVKTWTKIASGFIKMYKVREKKIFKL